MIHFVSSTADGPFTEPAPSPPGHFVVNRPRFFGDSVS